MVLSGISCFFLWFGTSESMMIAMLCLYNGLSISAWNSLDVVTAELYPTDRRYTHTHTHTRVQLNLRGYSVCISVWHTDERERDTLGITFTSDQKLKLE